jgi:phage portal protein BeeE
MGKFKDWIGRKFGTGAKSYQVQLLVGDDGFMVAQNFTGSDLYNVYTQAVWTYICASRISQDVGNFPAIVQRWDPQSGAWIRDPEHQLNQVLQRPYGESPGAPRWNWQQMISTGVLRQELSGNQFMRMGVVLDRLEMLGLYLTELEAVELGTTGLFTEYKIASTSTTIPADQIVNIMHANPGSFWRGVSPTIANEQATRVDYAASRRIRYDMETRVQPGVVFKVKALFTMSEAQRTATKAMLASTYEGATKQGKSLVVGDDTTIEGAPLHQVDDIPTHAANARDAIISSFDVSPPMVGVLRDAKYTNWKEAKRAHFNLCLLPRLNNIYGTINSQAIFPVYGQGVRLWYDLVQSPLGLEPIAERGETAKIFYDMGWPAKNLNEAFSLGMSEFPGWDQSNMASVVAGREPPDDEPEDEPELVEDGEPADDEDELEE